VLLGHRFQPSINFFRDGDRSVHNPFPSKKECMASGQGLQGDQGRCRQSEWRINPQFDSTRGVDHVRNRETVRRRQIFSPWANRFKSGDTPERCSGGLIDKLLTTTDIL
jgi:hypothetical protein